MGGLLLRELHELWRHRRQEHLAQIANNLLGERFRVIAALHRCRHLGEHVGGIAGNQRFDHIFGSHARVGLATAGCNQLECRQCVTCRTTTIGYHLADGFV